MMAVFSCRHPRGNCYAQENCWRDTTNMILDPHALSIPSFVPPSKNVLGSNGKTRRGSNGSIGEGAG